MWFFSNFFPPNTRLPKKVAAPEVSPQKYYPILEWTTHFDKELPELKVATKTYMLPEPYLYHLQEAYTQALREIFTGDKTRKESESIDQLYAVYTQEFERVFSELEKPKKDAKANE